MGTDIHGVWQKLNPDGTWLDIPSDYKQTRHYQLFAVLVGVRNGYGFAGRPTGTPVKPIAEPRGLPDDFHTERDCHQVPSVECVDPSRRQWAEEDGCRVWMGDHSHSWLFGDELLLWFRTATTVVQTGVVSRDFYMSWDRSSRPSEYCGGITGPGIRVIAESEATEEDSTWTHVQVSWLQSLKEELAYFFDEVQRLVDEHGTIRFVFGFDS